MATSHAWGDPARRVVGRAEGEFRDHLWIAWLVRTRILEDHALPLTFPQANAPLGLHLYPLDPLNQAAMTALAPLMGPVAAFTLVSSALLTLTGVAGARLARALGATGWAAIGAGVLAQLGPPVLGSLADSQTEGMGVGWMLLALSELGPAATWDRGRAARLGLFSAALVLSAPYQAHGIVVVLGLAAAWHLARRQHPLRLALLSAALALPAAGLAAAGLTSAEGGPGGQLDARSRDPAERDARWPPQTVVAAASIPPVSPQVSPLSPLAIGAWPREPRFLPPSTGPRRASGWLLPLLALGAAIRVPRARPWVAAAAAYATLALGSARDWDAWTALDGARIPLPFDLWYRYMPLGHLTWKPAQYAVPAWTLAAAAAALLPGRWFAVGALAVIAELQLTGPTPLPLPAMELHPLDAYLDLAADPSPTSPVTGRPAVIEFPARERSRGGQDALPFDALTAQLFHRHPIGATFGRGENSRHQALLDALAATLGWPVGRCPPLADALRAASSAGFGWLVVHGHLLTELERASLDAALSERLPPPRVYPDDVRTWALPPEPR